MTTKKDAPPRTIGAERPLLTGLAFGLTNPKAYPVALAMFSAIVAPYVDKLSLADAPRLMGAAFLGFLAADATLIFAAGLPGRCGGSSCSAWRDRHARRRRAVHRLRRALDLRTRRAGACERAK